MWTTQNRLPHLSLPSWQMNIARGKGYTEKAGHGNKRTANPQRLVCVPVSLFSGPRNQIGFMPGKQSTIHITFSSMIVVFSLNACRRSDQIGGCTDLRYFHPSRRGLDIHLPLGRLGSVAAFGELSRETVSRYALRYTSAVFGMESDFISLTRIRPDGNPVVYLVE